MKTIDAVFMDEQNSIDVKISLEDKTIWLNQEQLAKLFDRHVGSISKHIADIYKNDPFFKDRSNAKIAKQTQNRGRFLSKHLEYYNLDLISLLADRFNSDKHLYLQKFLNDFLKENFRNNEEIIIYDNGKAKLDVKVSPNEDTVWLNQYQISLLFETSQPNISMHIKDILDDKELEYTTYKDFLYMAPHGQQYPTRFYNLDMILAIGYRVKSRRAIEFRRWVSSVLKKYLLKGYSIDEDRVIISADNYYRLKNKVDSLEQEVADIKEKVIIGDIKERVLFDGQMFNAYELFNSIFLKAKEEVVVIDPYFDINGLSLLSKIDRSIVKIIIKGEYSKLNDIDITRYKKQFGEINVIDYPNNHDRFIIIDRKECFHVGASINHAGSKLFAISKLESSEHINFILNRMLNNA